MKKVIATTKAPGAIGPYSQAIEANGFVYISGQLFGEMNTVYGKYFKGDYPARAAFAVKELPKKALVEIEMIAAK